MPPSKEDIILGEILNWRPVIHHGDPGPEIYRILETLSEEKQRLAAGVISEAVGAIAIAKGTAYGQIGEIIGSQKEV